MINVVSKILTARNWPVLALLLSLSLWMGALAFQHIGGLQPCQMCYWQRHAHKAVLVIAILALISRYMLKTERWDRVFLALLALAFLVSFGLALWHMGVEYKWWEGPKSCAGGAVTVEPVNWEALKNTKMPSCGDVTWTMFGISMAGYNAIISLGAALMSFYFVVKAR